MRFHIPLSLGAALLALKTPFVSSECCACPNDFHCPGGGTCIPFVTCCGEGEW